MVALKGAIYNTNIGRVKWHSHECKSKDQVELTLKEFKTPFFSSDERKKNRVFRGYGGVMGPKSYNGAWGFGRKHDKSSLRRNISSDQLKHG